MTDPQLLEIAKVTAWQQCVIGRQAASDIRQALRLDTTPPPSLPIVPLPGNDRRTRLPFAGQDDPSPAHPRNSVAHPAFDRQNHGVWASTQLLLSAAANVSKLLWPTTRDENRFAADLRRLCAVDETSPLTSRELRNSFEHLGERITRWSDEHAGRQYVDSLIVATRQELPDPVALRAFVEDEFAVVFLGTAFELEPIVGALDDVATRADPAGGTHL